MILHSTRDLFHDVLYIDRYYIKHLRVSSVGREHVCFWYLNRLNPHFFHAAAAAALENSEERQPVGLLNFNRQLKKLRTEEVHILSSESLISVLGRLQNWQSW